MIVLSPGHWHKGTGAVGIVDEVTEARKVVKRLYELLCATNTNVKTIYDNTSQTKQQNLNYLVNEHLKYSNAFHVSIHFNSVAGGILDRAIGCEVLYCSNSMREEANRLSTEISKAGNLINRGGKQRTDLKWLTHFKNNGLLIEVCFVNSKKDVEQYLLNFEAICQGIAQFLRQKTSSKIAPYNDVPFKNVHVKNKVLNILQNEQSVKRIIQKGIEIKAIDKVWGNISSIPSTEDLLGLALIIVDKLAK